MEIRVSREQGRVPVDVFHISGELNADTSGQLDAEARRVYATGGRNFILDLAEVSYISSWGIRTISEIFTMLRAVAPEEDDTALRRGLRDGSFKSGHLKLLNVSPQVKRALSVAGVDMFLEMHEDLPAALASF